MNTDAPPRVDPNGFDVRGMKLELRGVGPDEFLDEIAKELWDAVSIIESTSAALEAHFGHDWPAAIPDYRRALRVAAEKVESVSGGIIEIQCTEEIEKPAVAAD